MRKIGITGGIGSGKSTVCKLFEMLGIPVFYADDVAKKLYTDDEEVKEKTIRIFGEGVYRNGQFDRGILAALIFQDEQKRQQLNAIIHPKVLALGEVWMKQQTASFALKEAALLIESNSYKQLDDIILVVSPLQKKMERIMQRDQLTEEQIELRMRRQMTDEEKRPFCKYEIINDDDHLLIEQVEQLMKVISGKA